MNDTLVRYLETNIDALAADATARMEARRPDLFDRYRERSLGRGRDPAEWCREDTAFHVRHLAAALDVDAVDEFRDYRRWLVGLLAGRGIPEEDVDVNFAALGDVLSARLGAEAAPALAMLSAR
jgi:hypothetical protein